MKQAGEVLYTLLESLTLSIEDVNISKAGVFVIDDAHASHDRDLSRIDVIYNGEPSTNNSQVGPFQLELGLIHAFVSIDKLFVGIYRFLLVILSKEYIDGAIEGATGCSLSTDLHVGQPLPDPPADIEALGSPATKQKDELVVHVAESEVLASDILRFFLGEIAIRAHPSATLAALANLEKALAQVLAIHLDRLPVRQVIVRRNGGIQALDALISAVFDHFDNLIGAALAEVGRLPVVLCGKARI